MTSHDKGPWRLVASAWAAARRGWSRSRGAPVERAWTRRTGRANADSDPFLYEVGRGIVRIHGPPDTSDPRDDPERWPDTMADIRERHGLVVFEEEGREVAPVVWEFPVKLAARVRCTCQYGGVRGDCRSGGCDPDCLVCRY